MAVRMTQRMSAETILTRADTPRPASREPIERALLIVYEGDVGARTRVVELPDRTDFTIGRSRTATVHIDSDRVSRIHARIRRRDSTIQIEDAGSRNGTWVNNTAIEGPTGVVPGDAIIIGPASIVVSVTTRAEARTAVESVSHLEKRLVAEVDRGRRYQRVFSLMMLCVAGDDTDTDAAVDRVAARLRPMDVLAEYSPSELAILLPEIPLQKAQEIARLLSREARTSEGKRVQSLEVRAGVASFPEHGTDAGSLIARARAAVRSAGHNAGEDTVGTPPDELAFNGSDIVVADPQTRRVYELAQRVADHSVTVLITGETGVGKEAVAGAIHRAGSRRDGPFIRLNCASISESLLESELFGHEQGAFTGADRRKRGFFEAADGGTLFLDEIGEVSPAIQPKLLRVLEDHKVTPVGGTTELSVDVRVICATNRDLESEARTGEFRQDLFFRISAFTIFVPPLRDRRAEIPLLVEHFLHRAAQDADVAAPRLTPAAADAVARYSWPGNVRELRNAVERAIIVHTEGVIDMEDLPDRVRDLPAAGIGGVSAVGDHDSAERAAIVAALDASNGNQTRAAKRLGITRRAIIYRMEKYGLKPPPGARNDQAP